VPPALDIEGGTLTETKSGKPAELHGLNWFGWETDTPGFDGLWVSGGARGGLGAGGLRRWRAGGPAALQTFDQIGWETNTPGFDNL
jgi:hypothetical protein